jgi:protease YdgD
MARATTPILRAGDVVPLGMGNRVKAIHVHLCLCLLLPAPAAAGDALRVNVPAADWPWSAIGRVNAVHGWCTGVLVGPKLAVTAAHCLWNRRTRRPMPVESLRFAAGWDRGEYLEVSPVTRYRLAPGWSFAAMERYGPAAAANDWALLDLEKPIGTAAGMIALGSEPAVGRRISTVGYGQHRKHVPTAEIGCRVVGRDRSGLWLHDCEAVHGDSGGPVITWVDGAPRLAGIQVASLAMEDGRRRGGLVGVAQFQDMARSGATTVSRPGHLSRKPDPALAAPLAAE